MERFCNIQVKELTNTIYIISGKMLLLDGSFMLYIYRAHMQVNYAQDGVPSATRDKYSFIHLLAQYFEISCMRGVTSFYVGFDRTF